MRRTEYVTKEAQESSIVCINGCINVLNNTPNLPYEIGTVTLDCIVKYLQEYKHLIEKDREGK